jgi:acyl carrier protein
MTPSDNEIMQAVREHLAREFPARRDEVAALGADVRLSDEGLVDSLSFAALVAFVEERFAVTVPPTHFAPQRFATLRLVARYVASAGGA